MVNEDVREGRGCERYVGAPVEERKDIADRLVDGRRIGLVLGVDGGVVRLVIEDKDGNRDRPTGALRLLLEPQHDLLQNVLFFFRTKT